jgi:acyl-CoA reductase-like NAD-dependent aldehyde dehydrogenase
MTMSMIQDVDAEQLAKVFHHYHEALAQDCDTHNDEASSAWERTPQSERKLMVAAARLTLLELAAPSAPASSTRKYYAKPGEAEWGS